MHFFIPSNPNQRIKSLFKFQVLLKSVNKDSESHMKQTTYITYSKNAAVSWWSFLAFKETELTLHCFCLKSTRIIKWMKKHYLSPHLQW